MADVSVITCTACQHRLVGSEERRVHYRSDLHRVNLKRKVGGLGPLTANEFSARVAALESERQSTQRVRQTYFCEVCSKKFSSEKALENHHRSRRHIDAVKRAAAAGDTMELSSAGSTTDRSHAALDRDADTDAMVGTGMAMADDDAVDAELARRIASGAGFTALECVFDGAKFGSVEENLDYMCRVHGFFVPFAEQLVDKVGLLTYLGQKVGVGYACVACDRGFGDVEAVQMHMQDKRHCHMCSDEELWMEEYGEFYDFGAAEGGDGDAGGWEEVDGEEAAVAEAAGAMVVAKGEVEDEEIEEVGAEAVGLAVRGKVLGHRSLVRYYRQSAGRVADSRVAVVTNRELGVLRRAALRERRGPMELRAERGRVKREQRFELMVGSQNYYTRKARFKQSMAVFNSGYRA